MVEKIIVNPESVRCYGNVMGSKDVEDFECYESVLEAGTDTVNGQETDVFMMDVLPSVSVSATYPYLMSGETTDIVVLVCDSRNNAPLAGRSVSVSDGTSVYTGITNSNGIAQVTVSVSAETTFTCSYSNVTDTCTVTVPAYLFYDSGVTGTKNTDFLCTKSSSAYTLTTDANGTTFVCTGSDGFYIPNIDIHSYSSLEITWTFTYGTIYACQVSLLKSTKANANNMRWHNAGSSTPTTSWYNPSGSTTISHTLTAGDTMKLVKNNNTFTLYCNDISLGSGTPSWDVYYVAFTSADGNRPFGYKELTIKEV